MFEILSINVSLLLTCFWSQHMFLTEEPIKSTFDNRSIIVIYGVSFLGKPIQVLILRFRISLQNTRFVFPFVFHFNIIGKLLCLENFSEATAVYTTIKLMRHRNFLNQFLTCTPTYSQSNSIANVYLSKVHGL